MAYDVHGREWVENTRERKRESHIQQQQLSDASQRILLRGMGIIKYGRGGGGKTRAWGARYGEDGYGRRGRKRLRVRAGLDSKMKHRASKRVAAIVRSRSFSNVTGLRTTGISIALSLVPEQHLPVRVSECGRINDTRGERE